MPDPTRLARTLEQAIRAFDSTPGRQGHVVALSDASDVLVAGDLHGNVDNLRALLDRAKLPEHPNRHFVLQELIHGPNRYSRGGDKSHQLVDLLAALKCQFPRQVHMLLGNHELAQWTNQWIAKEETDLNESFRQGVDTAYGPMGDTIYALYRDLFAAVSLAVRTPNRVFLSHSLPSARRLETFDPTVLERDGYQEADLLAGGAAHALVWGRDTSPAHVAAFLQKVDADLLITGHIPHDQGFLAPNDRQLILDCVAAPAGYCLFPTDRPLTHPELVQCAQIL